MKRKLIEMEQDYLVVCDNPNCDFKVENTTKNPYADISKYLNAPCPKCGENLLTEKDYQIYLILVRYVKFMNKWFSWTLFFKRNKKTTKATVHTHNGISMTKIE